MSAYATVRQMRKMLSNLDAWLAEAVTVAEDSGYDVEALLEQRLYPDMFTLRRQIQSACDVGKFTAGRLAGVKPPAHPDGLQTLGELRGRLAEVLSFIDGIDESAFEGAEDRSIGLPTAPNKGMVGRDYVIEFAMPNFSFHLCMAYALLRHNGVKLGKRKYLGAMNIVDIG